MKKKRTHIIIGIFILLLVAVAIWFFGILNKNEQKNTLKEAGNLFPFGQVQTGNPIKNTENQDTVGNENIQQTTEQETETTETAGPRLRRITDFPIGGFAALVRSEDKEVTDIEVNSDGTSTQSVKTIKVENNYVRYSVIDDASLFETRITPSTLTEELLTENFIPNAEHVLFSKNGDNALFQYWNKDERTIETYLGKIKKKELDIKECPYNFKKKIVLGDKGEDVFNLHEFLNKNPQTRIATKGINSPGNETGEAIAATITAIKNFQSLYDLDIDGALGPATQKKMLEICDDRQKKKAEELFNKLETRYDISGFFLPQGIVSLDISPKGDSFFSLQKDTVGVVGIVRNFLDNSKETIFESPYTEWLTIWNNINNIEITTKASYQSDGYSYSLKPSNKEYHKSFKQRSGLTTLASPDNRKILLNESKRESIRTSLYTRKSHRMKPLNIQTFPEKCVWSKDSLKIYCAVPNSLSYGNEYPDIWYQGVETTIDSLWEIDSRTGQTKVISDFPTEYNEDIDVVKIGIDKNSDYLYFIDKNSEFLWSYRLTNI